jgi:hypothetical protein
VNAEDNTPVRVVIGRPFPPGVSGNPGGAPKGLAEVRRLAQEHTPRAVARLAEWIESDNAKASVPACVAIYQIAYGRIGAYTPESINQDGPGVPRIDLSALSPDEFRTFRELCVKAKSAEVKP